MLKASIAIAERDNALEMFRTEMQNYIDGLTEIMGGNNRIQLTDKADEVASNLSSDNIKLSHEISSIEIHRGILVLLYSGFEKSKLLYFAKLFKNFF